MRTMNIFDILTANGVLQGGTIHQIAKQAKKTTKTYWQSGLLCYKFIISQKHQDGRVRASVKFDGCVDGRLIATKPDKHLAGYNNIVQITPNQKEIIERAIL